MQSFKANIGTWNRSRPSADGGRVDHKLYVVNFRCPDTGRKRRMSFKRKAAAEDYLAQLLAEVHGQRYYNTNTDPTVAEVVDHWAEIKRPMVKAQTMKGYGPLMKIITGPILQGTPRDRAIHEMAGVKPHRDTKLLQMLGSFKVSSLQTGQLRRWHTLVREEVGAHTANRVMSMLKGILALAEEDFGVRICSMPTNLARRKSKPKKNIPTPEEVAKLITFAKNDKEKGIYYAFPFLTGVRVSEQLGLLWQDVDLDNNVITIRRVLERDGTTSETTKTEAGTREIPISATLRTMLLEWRLRCPRLDGELYRVFGGPGRPVQWPKQRTGGGGPVLYTNYTKRYWRPAFAESGIRYVTHHSARHNFVSVLQQQGVAVGLVAKLAGHANPAVTLAHYTQAVSGGADAIAALDRAYQNN